MASLSTLPTELLHAIGDFSPLPVLNTLSRLNHRFFNIFVPRLYKSALLNCLTYTSLNAVLWAMKHNRTFTMQYFIDAGFDVNTIFPEVFGVCSVLHYAAILTRDLEPGDTRMVELLLENGANTEVRNRKGLTAAHLALEAAGETGHGEWLMLFV